MAKILTEISFGELLDKITILDIKLKKIKNPFLRKEVEKEYAILLKIKKKNIKKSKFINKLYNDLKKTNIQIWNIENLKRKFEKKKFFDKKFINISRKEYKANDQRAKIKSEINNFLNSNIKEVKQHI